MVFSVASQQGAIRYVDQLEAFRDRKPPRNQLIPQKSYSSPILDPRQNRMFCC